MKKTLPLALLLLLLCFLPERCLLLAAGDLHPIILVPGHQGNQLEAQLTMAYEPSSPICTARKSNGWFRLWLDSSLLSNSQSQKCFADQIRLHYDLRVDDFRNAPGVHTRVPFFGSTKGLSYRDPDDLESSAYMAPLVEHLEKIGYVDGENLFGAPYDFRYGLAPYGHNQRVGSRYLHDLRDLVENASRLNGGKPVIILSHSYAGPVALQFLKRNPVQWRRRFIKHFVPLSAIWGGLVYEMLFFASGNDLGFPFVDRLIQRQQSRSFESNLWLLPSPRVFGDAPLVVSKQGNYSAATMSEFLEGIGFGEGVLPYRTRILPLTQELDAPLVPVTAITGTGLATAEVLIYGDGGFDEFPEIVSGDGDGIVNLKSLLAVESEWSKLPEQEFKMIKLPNITHYGTVEEESALNVVIEELQYINSGVPIPVPKLVAEHSAT